MSKSNIDEIEIKTSIDRNKVGEYNNTLDNMNLNQNIETDHTNNENIHNSINNNQMQHTKIEDTNMNSDYNIEENIHDITSNNQVDKNVITELKSKNNINSGYNIESNIIDNDSNKLIVGNKHICDSNINVYTDINEDKVNTMNNTNSETEVVVYKVSDDYQSIVCQVVEKSYKLNKKCLLLCNNTEEIAFFDSKLWTYSKLSFIPHGSKYSMNANDAIYCNTWISDTLVYVNNPNYLIVLGNLLKNDITHNFWFEKIIFILYNETNDLDLIRNKYQYCTIWKQSNNKWVKNK